MNKNGQNSIKVHIDLIGIVTALICAIHCLALPLLITFSALSGLTFLTNPLTEAIILFISILIASISFIPALKNQHRNYIPITMLAIGILILLSAHFLEDYIQAEIFTICGASLLIIAHLINWLLCKNAGELKQSANN